MAADTTCSNIIKNGLGSSSSPIFMKQNGNVGPGYGIVPPKAVPDRVEKRGDNY